MKINKFMIKTNDSKIKGYIGERIVNKFFKKYKYRIHNLKIIGSSNAQIDHLLISEKGIIVIETKNYKGLIVGKKDDNYWKQYLNNRVNLFLNPIKQNDYHIKILKELHPEFDDLFVSIIVFMQDCKLNVNSDKVIKLSLLNKTIRNLKTLFIKEDYQKEVFEIFKDYKLKN